jgi:DNA-binding beta-propeller fold protein YncE
MPDNRVIDFHSSLTYGNRMRRLLLLSSLLAPGLLIPGLRAADLSSAPKLPHKLVQGWAKLPDGWNFGETSGVDVDKDGNVWVFNRGPHPVIQFDKSGRMLQAWEEVPVTTSHGLRVDPDGNVWLVDVKGHAVMKFSRDGRLQMVITNAGKRPGDNGSRYAFNEPTSVAFRPNGDFLVSDGYVNARVIQFTKAGEYVRHWGKKGTGDGEFDLVHDVVLDSRGRVYVADRNNARIQVFDADGRFLAKWTHAGAPWGLAYAAGENALYMCDGEANRVVKLNLDGQVLGVLGGFGKAPGLFDFAHHMAVDSEGSIYVAEIKNWRVQKFAK